MITLMGRRSLQSALVSLSVIASTLISACKAQDAQVQGLDLRAGLPSLDSPGVPALHEKLADGDEQPKAISLTAAARRWAQVDDLRVSNPASPVKARLKADASAERVVMTLWDWENRPVLQRTFATPVDQDVSFNVKDRGVYIITLDGFAKDKCVYRLVRSIAHISTHPRDREEWSKSDFWLGICAFPGRYHWSSGGKPSIPDDLSEQEARELEATLISQLNLTRIRLDVSMVLPENDTTKIDWKRMDAAVSAWTGSQAARGLALQLMHPPDWAIDPKYKDETKDRWRFPRQENAYRRYVRELVTRYGKHAAFVQVYNEPDQTEFWPGPREEYVREVTWAKEEIRKVLPDAGVVPIANGGYAFIDPAKTAYYVKELKGALDLQAYHSHGNLRELVRDHDMMRKLHAEAGYEKPRYVNTECGFAAWRLDQERAQAIAILQKIVYCWAHGDEGMLLFCSRMTKGPGRSGRDFGLLDYHFCPRFAYGAVAAFTETYAGARFERVLSDKGNVHAYVFAQGDRKLVALFTMDKPEPVTLTSDAKAGSVIDAMGNAAKLEAAGQVKIEATPYLKTVVLEGATKVMLNQ